MGGGSPEVANVLLPPASKRAELINFSGQSKVLGVAIAPIASIVGRIEAPSPSTVITSILHGSSIVIFYRQTLKIGKNQFSDVNCQKEISDP